MTPYRVIGWSYAYKWSIYEICRYLTGLETKLNLTYKSVIFEICQVPFWHDLWPSVETSTSHFLNHTPGQKLVPGNATRVPRWLTLSLLNYYENVNFHLILQKSGSGTFWIIRSIPSLRMTWLLLSPGHQQAWYWPVHHRHSLVVLGSRFPLPAGYLSQIMMRNANTNLYSCPK